MPLTVQDKKVLRAHGFYSHEFAITRNEIFAELEKVRKEMGRTRLTEAQLVTLNNIYYKNGGDIDNVSQQILAKQFKVSNRKIQAECVLFFNNKITFF